MKHHVPQQSNTAQHQRVAVIAGTGTLPFDAIRCLQTQGTPFFVISLFPETNGVALQALTPEVVAQKFYKMGTIIETLKKRGTTHVLFIGKVDKRNLLKKLSYDWLFAKLAAKALVRSDSALMELLLAELTTHGIAPLSQREVLGKLFVPPGVLIGSMTDELHRDVELGLQTAEALSQNDIGQTVVVKDGMVLAVEAIEGTDECIARGIALGKGSVVVCKTARTSQSDAYDIPTLGPATLVKIQPGQVAVLAWHAKRTMIADVERFCAIGRDKEITFFSSNPKDATEKKASQTLSLQEEA